MTVTINPQWALINSIEPQVLEEIIIILSALVVYVVKLDS